PLPTAVGVDVSSVDVLRVRRPSDRRRAIRRAGTPTRPETCSDFTTANLTRSGGPLVVAIRGGDARGDGKRDETAVGTSRFSPVQPHRDDVHADAKTATVAVRSSSAGAPPALLRPRCPPPWGWT